MRIAWGFMASLAVLAACQTPHPPPVTEAPSECARLASVAQTLNTTALFEATAVCIEKDRKEDANYLIMVAQVRAMTDISTLTPANETDPAFIDLAGVLYSGMGGLGFPEVYRDTAAVDRLAARVEATQISFTTGYDPGWVHKPGSKVDIYDVVAFNARQQRVWQMRNYALLMQNDAYYEAYVAQNELQEQNGVFVEGTPAYEESSRLFALMNAAAATVVQHPPPESTLPYTRLNEPDADANFRQIAVGLNGPADSQTDLFNSAAEAEASWLSGAYSADALGTILDSIDFTSDVLIVYAVGERANASGKMTVNELEYDSRFAGYSIGVRVGIVSDSCGEPRASSFPFVLATVARGETSEINGTSMSHYPDTCGPIAKGQAVSPN